MSSLCRVLEIPVNSNTTCGEVINAVKQELGLLTSVNGFGLFEACGPVEKYLEDKVSLCELPLLSHIAVTKVDCNVARLSSTHLFVGYFR
jgi:hypothetical protein